MLRRLHGADAKLTASKACVCQSQSPREATLPLLDGIRVMTGSPPEKSKVPLYDIIPITQQGRWSGPGVWSFGGTFSKSPETSGRAFSLPRQVGTSCAEREQYVSAPLQLGLN